MKIASVEVFSIRLPLKAVLTLQVPGQVAHVPDGPGASGYVAGRRFDQG